MTPRTLPDLRAAVARVATDSTLDAAARTLGVDVATLRRWRGTWLKGDRE